MLKKMGGKKRYNKLIILLLLFIFLLLIFFIFEYNLRPTIRALAESKANLLATEVINKVIYEDVMEQIEYNDLVNIHKDTLNKITLIQVNSVLVSKLISNTNLKIKESLEVLKSEEFNIPLGQAIGSYLFAAYGPNIKVKIIPAGEIDVKLYQDFHEAGINQTRHILYLDVETSVKVVVPMATDKIKVKNRLPIAESIIVGSVPNTVVRLGDGYDLIKGYLFNGINK